MTNSHKAGLMYQPYEEMRLPINGPVFACDKIYVGGSKMDRDDATKSIHIGPGSIIGYHGFQTNWFEFTPPGRNLERWQQIIEHKGGVRFGYRVMILCGVMIARGIAEDDFTEIGTETCIDNIVHIAHNVKIGQQCRIAAGAIIGGSCVIGNNVFIGLNATIRDGIKIGDGAYIGCGAVVVKDVPPDTTVVGNPAKPLVKRSEAFLMRCHPAMEGA